MSIRLLLVDENDLFRQGLCALVAARDDFTVVADLRGGKEAVQATLHFDPDVVLMDTMGSGINGLESLSQIKCRRPQVKVLVLTTLRTEDHVRESLRAGADGYVLKDASLDELLTAVRCVARGKTYLSPDVSGHVVQRFLHPESRDLQGSRLESLTTRERSILQLVAEGGTNRMAAEMLNVSPKTIEKHRAKLMHKLGLRNATELTLVALDLGLIERPLTLSRSMAHATPSACPNCAPHRDLRSGQSRPTASASAAVPCEPAGAGTECSGDDPAGERLQLPLSLVHQLHDRTALRSETLAGSEADAVKH